MAQKWETKIDPKVLGTYGLDELHTACFMPPGWSGAGATVVLGLPECELIVTMAAPDGEPVAMVNRPEHNRDPFKWTRSACQMAREGRAMLVLNCDTEKQMGEALRRIVGLLPGFERLPLERMYDGNARVRRGGLS